MDARPHRPLRTMRTFNDENALPNAPFSKTIHQRNKSSPALANMVNGATLKTAAKRTAFGDVSNTIGSQKVGKDDASSFSKPSYNKNFKPGPAVVSEKKSAALLRPAQRPLSVSNLKHLLTGSVQSTNSTQAQQEASTDDSLVPLPTTGVLRKPLTKRGTTIFKDVQLDTVQEHIIADPEKHTVYEHVLPKPVPPPTEITLPESGSQLYLPPPEVPLTSEPVKESCDTSTKAHNPDSTQDPTNNVISDSVVLEGNQSETVELKDDYLLSQSIASYILEQTLDLPSPPKDELRPQSSNTHEDKPLPPPHQSKIDESMNVLESHLVTAPRRAEPEEYWEEDEEEVYEEDGYVTARSFHSKGDNTTGGATTVLVPRMNQKARREIEAATKLVESTRTLEEVEDEAFDTSMVAEYGDEIFEYMRQLEVKMSPNPHYMDNQHEIQWSMRSVLMDWLVQVHHRFNLLPETLFLCVNYIDRFLSCKVVSLGKLQLVGATAIFIAAKYEEINCPSVQEIVYMVDGGYSIDEILKAERFMLTMLQFELGWPGPMSFLRRISKADDYDLETRTLAKYFLEVTLMDERFIGSPPSFTAAASHCLARMMLRKGAWSPHHVYYSGYTFTQLKPLIQLLLDCCEDSRKHHSAVYNKYCDKRYKLAAIFVENEINRGFVLPQSPITSHQAQTTVYGYYSTNGYYGL